MKKWHNYTGEDFTFVVVAYKECPYLEEAIQTVMNQTVKTKVMISTATPNDFINGLAEKYDIPVAVNPDGGHVKDYNFAMKQIQTPLGMLMHQDEQISKHFVEKVIDAINHAKRPIIAFTNYIEMHNDKVDEKASTMVKIKRMLLWPAHTPLRGTALGKWLMQCLGDPITHPTVTCVMKEMPDEYFREAYTATMDWDFWQRLSKQKGDFVYIPDVLLHHRMNDDNQTAKLIGSSNVRVEEELEIFCRFWPKPIARLIMCFYKKAGKYY